MFRNAVERVSFANVDAGKSSIGWVLADGSGPAETLAQLEGQLRPSSCGGGRVSRWARGGRELFYVAGGKVIAVEIEPGSAFRAGMPKELFTYTFPGFPAYDVSADGKRFLMIKSGGAEPDAHSQLNFVLEWFEDIRRRVRAGG